MTFWYTTNTSDPSSVGRNNIIKLPKYCHDIYMSIGYILMRGIVHRSDINKVPFLTRLEIVLNIYFTI